MSCHFNTFRLGGEESFGTETSTERRKEGDDAPRPMEQKEKEEKELRNNEAHVRQPGSAPRRLLGIFKTVFSLF